MIENTARHIGTASIMMAGLFHSFNPASFLGMVLFALLLVRMQKVYQLGDVIGGVLLFVFFVVQVMTHIFIADIFYVYSPELLNGLHILRAIMAGMVLLAGIVMSIKLWQGSEQARTFLSNVIYAFLPQDRKVTVFSKVNAVLKACCWGMFLGFFCGLWPLDSEILSLIHSQMLNLSSIFLGKIFLFNIIVFIPFFLVVGFAAKSFRSEAFRRRIMNSRIVLVLFSGLLVAIGSGTLICYLKFLM